MMLRGLFRSLRAEKAPAATPASPPAPDASVAPSPPADMLQTAHALFREGRFTDARLAAENAEAKHGRTDVSVRLRAQCLQYERRFAEAAALHAALAGALQGTSQPGDRRYADTLIDWGLALLRDGRSEEASEVLARAARAAPDHPPAIGCARFPALMRRAIDLPRRPLPPRRPAAASPLLAVPIEVVYFFAGRPDDARFAEYMALLQASADAARRAQPSVRLVVLSDRDTPFPAELGMAVERFDFDREALMLARFRAIAAYLRQKADRDEPVRALFCDPDTLVVRPLDDILDGTYDVAYTARSRFVEERLDHEPFVAGATFVAADDARRPLRFFQHVLDAFDTVAAWPEVTGFYPHPIAVWRGDQVVPAAVVGWETFRANVLSGHTDRLEIDGVTVAFLPSDPYCFTFEPDVPDAVLAMKRVIDFKGARKAHLAAVAQRLASVTVGRESRTVHRLATVEEAAAGLDGATVTRRISDPLVPATAQPLDGALQHAAWSQPFTPLAAVVLRLARATAVGPNLLVLPDGRLLDDANGFPPSEQVRHAASRETFIAAGGGMLVLAEPSRDPVTVDHSVAYLAASRNYAEWLLGDVPRALLYADDAALVLHGDAQPMHLETLELVGVGRERVHAYPATARLSFTGGVSVCTTTFRHHTPCATAVRVLRERARERVPTGGPRKVYLSRAGVPGSRRIRNEADVEAMLREQGFAIVRPERLGVREQAAAVAGAEVIVGPYGANLANLVFAPPRSRAVIIATKHQPEFARLLAILGVPFRHVVPAAVQVRQGRTYSESVEFDVDLALLARAVQD